MNKAISVAAVLALAAASNEFADHELINLHLEQPRLHRPTFSPLVRDVAHDDEQMIRLSPELVKPHYRTFTPLVADDNDDEFVYATALRLDDNDDQYFVADDEFYVDDEFFVEQADNELGFFKKIGDGLKKAGQFVVSHPQIITTAAKFLDDDEFYADDELVLRPDREIGRPRPRLPPYIVADDEFVYASPLRADDDEFFVDQQADDEFLIRLDPALTRPHTRIPLPIMTADDNDDEFFVDQQADDEFLIRLDPALTRPHTRIPLPIMTADDNDDEFFVEQADNELGFFKKIGDGLKKAGKFVVSHPQIITTAAKFLDDDEFYAEDDEFFVDEQVNDEFFAHDAALIKKAQRQVRPSTGPQDSLSSLGGLLREGKRLRPVKPQEVQDNMNFLEDFQDNNLSIKDKLKGAANWIADHPQVITEAAKTYKILKGKH